MNYKKLHEDTINRLQQMVSCGKITVEAARGICADFIPESEDEKIRKELIEFFNQFENGELRGVDITPWIAWLKKRCEQKFVDKCKDCNNVKGCITCTDGDQYAHITEQKPTDKIEPKFKVGDSIKTANEEPLTITEITDIGYWSEDLFICNFDDADKWELVEKKIETIEIPFGAKDSELMGATYYIPEGFHAEIDGNKVIIKQGEQKPAWSEEDEEMLQKALSTIRYALSIPIDKENDPCFAGSSTISWLKSLKEKMKGK